MSVCTYRALRTLDIKEINKRLKEVYDEACYLHANIGGGGAVSSVFGRTGVVIAASNDYTFAQLASKPTTLSGYGITDAAPTASPTFTGTVTIPTPFTLGAVSVTATGTELNFVSGVTSAIQTQLDAKQASLTFTSPLVNTAGTIDIGGLTGLGAANEILGMNNAGTAYEYKTLSLGTTAQSNDLGWVLSDANAAVLHVPDASGTVRGVITTGTQTIAGAKTFSGTLTTGTFIATANILTTATGGASNFAATGGTLGTTSATAQLLAEGASSTGFRVYMRGSSALTLLANNNYSNFIVGETTVTEAATGTHPLIASLIVKPVVVTGAAGATANMASLYVEAAPSGVTPTGRADAIRVAGGNVYLANGNLDLGTAGNKLNIATGSNASVGTATLVSGTVTVATTAVATNSIIFVSLNTPGGTLGIGYSAPIASIVNATSFVINAVDSAGSVVATDVSTINYWIINS